VQESFANIAPDPNLKVVAMKAAFTLMQVLAWTATIAIMFSGAVRLGLASLRQIREKPMLFLRTLLAVWVAVPVLTMLVVVAFDVRGMYATTFLLMAVCPGMPLLLATTRSVKGAMGTAFVALLLTATLEPLLIPSWTRVLSLVHPDDLTVGTRDVLAVLVPTVFIPVLAGFAVRRVAPGAAATLAHISERVAQIGIVADVLVVLIQGAPLLTHMPARAYGAAVVVTIGDGAIGYWSGWPNIEDQQAIATASALGNPALALAVIGTSYPGLQGGALIAVYLIVRTIAMLPFEWWLRRRNRLRPLRA
jgi:BASS family bile acid:Na+ symporter